MLDPDRTIGPRVYLDYDQDALDAAYNQAVYAPNIAVVTQRYVTNSAAARQRLGEPERFAYGPTAAEYLELYRASGPQAPVLVFFHGGAWKSASNARYDFVAEPFVRAGANVVLAEFTGVEETGGNLMTLADQVRSAVVWVHENASRLGVDRERVFVFGHSSGAHLAAVVATTTDRELSDRVKGVLCCSGMYDLVPVSLSKRNAYVHFDSATIEALSPQRHVASVRVPFVLAYGTCESPEFQRQPREFARALEDAGKSVRVIVGEGYNHFEFVERLADPRSTIGRAAFELLGLVPG